MVNRITPEIVIKGKEINCCGDCPFFEESVNGWGERSYYCNHDQAKFVPIGGIPEYKFIVDDGTIEGDVGNPYDDDGIWINCPLPRVDTV